MFIKQARGKLGKRMMKIYQFYQTYPIFTILHSLLILHFFTVKVKEIGSGKVVTFYFFNTNLPAVFWFKKHLYGLSNYTINTPTDYIMILNLIQDRVLQSG